MKNVKKTLSLILVAVMLLCSLPMAVSAAEYTQDGYTYTVADGKATITKTDSSVIKGDVTVPSTLGTYPVVAIGDNAFYGNQALTGVSIPSSVNTIGKNAFVTCTNLTSVSLPNSLKSIGGNAFAYCSSLTDIVIPDSVTKIDIFAFSKCTSLSKVIIGSSVTSIGSNVFFGCDSLKRVVIPANVTSIGNGAFGVKSENMGNRVYYSDFTIEGYDNTAAKRYATTNKIPFSVHTHTFGEWSVATEATCQAVAIEKRTCSGCGHIETRNGETFASHIDTDSDGLCDTCGATIVKPTEPSALNDKTAKILAAVFEFIAFLVDAIIELVQSSQGA